MPWPTCVPRVRAGIAVGSERDSQRLAPGSGGPHMPKRKHTPAPGWYPESGSLRYWDGAAWSDARRELPRQGERRNERIYEGAHVVAPQTFGEAEEVAGGFEHSIPVVLDMRTTERQLADRLIDFVSGLAFGLGGTMEQIAEDLLLILPPDVRISAEQAARLRDPRSFEP
jgi:cell division inhibitor SepF